MAEKLTVDRIWWRNITPSNFYDIERIPQKEGGGGSRYIEVPSSVVSETLDFLGRSDVDKNSIPTITIQAAVIGAVNIIKPIVFESKSSGRMRIANQNRQQEPIRRHTAWTREHGFPTAPDDISSTVKAKEYLPEGGLRVYIVKTQDGRYFAGHTKGPRPEGMEPSDPHWGLYDSSSKHGGGVISATCGLNMTDKMIDILTSWGEQRNVLLYGPPATGKTRLISELFQNLNSTTKSDSEILLDPHNASTPFSRPEYKMPIPKPVKVIWTTFHQSYGYEDFVLGLRPKITNNGTTLEPHAGVLLDAIIELSDPDSEYKSVVIFIDEVNRGNAARIFGEFMTFLDFDYRKEGRIPLPIPLRQLHYVDGLSEAIHRPGGKTVNISEGLTFPMNIYIVATMNSVDRAAVPIDSALARRFNRIEMRPDFDELSKYWGFDKDSVPTPTDDNCESFSPFITAYLVLDRINAVIATDLGPEFELGHGLLMKVSAYIISDDGLKEDVDEDSAWRSLAKTWDDTLFPQLEDRYSGRHDQLIELLYVDQPPQSDDYAWKTRNTKSGSIESRALAPVRVGELSIEVIRRSFGWLMR